MRWILGISFLSVAVWALFPDKYQGDDERIRRAGAFLSTLCAFFLAEIGDKTQIATIGLAARFEAFYPVVIGTTLGMMLANIPAVLIADRLPVKAIRITAAIVFEASGRGRALAARVGAWLDRSSQQTPRWREQASNHRFRARRPASSRCRLSFARISVGGGSGRGEMSRS